MSAHENKRERLGEWYNKLDGAFKANGTSLSSRLRQELVGIMKEVRRDTILEFKKGEASFTNLASLSMPQTVRSRE
jgi:hypothetical protein